MFLYFKHYFIFSVLLLLIFRPQSKIYMEQLKITLFNMVIFFLKYKLYLIYLYIIIFSELFNCRV